MRPRVGDQGAVAMTELPIDLGLERVVVAEADWLERLHLTKRRRQVVVDVVIPDLLRKVAGIRADVPDLERG